MAIAATTRLGSNTSATAATSIAVTPTGGILAGDTVIVACATEATAISAPTDNAAGGGNVYQQITSEVSNTDSIELWMCVNAKAATIVTMNCASSRLSCCVACYTGASLYDDGNTATGSALNPSLTTTQDSGESWVIAGFAAHGVGAYTAGTGTLRVSVAGAGSTTPGCAIVDNHGAAGAVITTSVTHTAVTWSAASAVLEMAEAGLLVPGVAAGGATTMSSVASG